MHTTRIMSSTFFSCVSLKYCNEHSEPNSIYFLKQNNAKIREECEDLHAQLISRDLETGRSLLKSAPSLASEFEELPRDEVCAFN